MTRTPNAGTAAREWAAASGVTGLIGNVLFILYFVLAPPWRSPAVPWAWLGQVNDVAVAVQFATFIPVPPALRDRLPNTGPVRAATVAAVLAMFAAAVLQFLLVAGVLTFEVQVPWVCAAFLVVFLWVLVVSRTAYRTAALPRRVARAGLLIGSAFPLGGVVAAVGLLAPGGSPARYVAFGLGAATAGAGWLALPVWPLLLAVRSLGRPAGSERRLATPAGSEGRLATPAGSEGRLATPAGSEGRLATPAVSERRSGAPAGLGDRLGAPMASGDNGTRDEARPSSADREGER